MELILIRHAAPAIDRSLPASQWGLSVAGRTASRAVAQHLRGSNVAHVVASSEPKAAQTAEQVAGRLDITCSVEEGLHEHLRQTVGFFETPEAFRSAVARFFAEPESLVLGEETAAAAGERFERAVAGIIRRWPYGGPVVAVSHGTVISLLVERWTGRSALETWSRLTLPALVRLSLTDRTRVEIVDF